MIKVPRFRSRAASGRTGRWSARRTSPRPCQALYSPDRDQIIEQRALDQRPQIAAHPDIGFDAVRRAGLETQRMFGVDGDEILDIGAKRQPRLALGVLDIHLDRQEGRVVDLDADPLDGRHQHMAVARPCAGSRRTIAPAARALSASPGKTTCRRRRCACRSRRNRADSTDEPARGRVCAPRRPRRGRPAPRPARGRRGRFLLSVSVAIMSRRLWASLRGRLAARHAGREV